MIKLGQRLKEERLSKNLTIEEVAVATKIRPQFISAIEQGNYKKLPSKAYAQGFVKNYVVFLGLPLRESLAMFRREFDEREYVPVLPESFTQQKKIPLTRKHWKRTVMGIGCVLLILLGYLVFQYRAALFAPSLTVTSPKEHATMVAETVMFTGTTEVNATVSVNNQQTYVDSTGHFTKRISVFPGKTTITIVAINTFGKRKIIERHITVNTSP